MCMCKFNLRFEKVLIRRWIIEKKESSPRSLDLLLLLESILVVASSVASAVVIVAAKATATTAAVLLLTWLTVHASLHDLSEHTLGLVNAQL